MKIFNKPSYLIKTLILLLIVSLLWFCAVMELLYNLLFYEFEPKLSLLEYGTQLKIVYVLGVVIIVAYSMLIFFRNNNESNHNFN
ncbi:hypothetical protein [Flavobacterium sp.]|jgi:hypothetical protein|uniref:hypothetical protein n=1 Tax=Flavobacterium sp. TaxID=239 RepID=UPI0040478F1D